MSLSWCPCYLNLSIHALQGDSRSDFEKSRLGPGAHVGDYSFVGVMGIDSLVGSGNQMVAGWWLETFCIFP